MSAAADRLVVLGRIAGVFGLRGELKVESYTEPRDGICDYSPWLLKRGEATDDQLVERVVEMGRPHGKGVVVRLEGITDIDLARALIGSEVLVPRSALPEPAEGEHYWNDLEGMLVVTVDGVELGEVSHLFETGANDVMVVKGDRERLIPYIPGVISAVDATARTITVDWDPDF
jgi:16S rRNA processing protein RimM